MSFILQANSSDQVTLEPEFDFAKKDVKIENQHRARAGDRTVFFWASYKRISFSIRYVNSMTMSRVNEWWENNINLQFYEQGTTDITSCQLTNRSLPIGEFIKPHIDQFEGRIELEEY